VFINFWDPITHGRTTPKYNASSTVLTVAEASHNWPTGYAAQH